MRIAIREQLAVLVLLTVLIALAIVSIPTWIYVNGFVIGVESGGLALTASLKAASISSEIELVQASCKTISTRLLIQAAFVSFYRGNETPDNWADARRDIQSALDAGFASSLLQAKMYSRNTTGNPGGLVNVTGISSSGTILLPYKTPDGADVFLGGSGDLGFPPSLYPNITYSDSGTDDPYDPGHNGTLATPFPEVRLDNGVDALLLGPLIVNSSYSMYSITVPVRQNSNSDNVLGYMTIVAEARGLTNIVRSGEGLGNTGSVLIVGPATGWNRFNRDTLPSNTTHEAPANFSTVDVQFVLPPESPDGQSDRHSERSLTSESYSTPFTVTKYPAVYRAFTEFNDKVNNASSMLSTHNEQGVEVSVGYARPQTGIVNWTIVVEQDRSEAYGPAGILRKILLGCVFGTTGLILVVIFPCAHLGVLPIRRLKTATEKSVAPPGYAEAYMDDTEYEDSERHGPGVLTDKPEKRTFSPIKRLVRGNVTAQADPAENNSDSRRRIFKVPGKVDVGGKHYITDELTELTTTFNDMSDELLKQYHSLEEKVRERTSELEISKKAAEAANESKTLFIANISHELKTPLNGILGMCAVCMEEDDLTRIKQSLKTLYKSGDLLLHLLEDLLSFSKNQMGQQLSIEQREFRLGDIRSQVLTIFDKQVREGHINFSVAFIATENDPDGSPDRMKDDGKLPALGPGGTGRIKDMCLWGDQHRILQVLINLVSNSLKFTPAGGKVSVRIKCLGEVQDAENRSRTSSFSRTSARPGRNRRRLASGSHHSTASTPPAETKGGTALAINPIDTKVAHIPIRERSPTPPPSNAKPFMFEFEVEDSGPGIPEHMQQRVFEPFVQGDLGLSKKFGGTGLGLSICQQLATLMGGQIHLQSTVGVGTTFTMRIPLKYTQHRASSTASSSIKSRRSSAGSVNEMRRNSASTGAEVKASVLDKQPRLVGLSQPFFAANVTSTNKTTEAQMKAIDRALSNKTGKGRLRVLVADDNSTNVEVVSRMLKLEDVYDVTIAKDGQEAYDLVKANMENNLHFDVIFMDIQMPNLDGLQSTRLIRKMGYSAPIVALTAFSEESNVKECTEAGMDEFLAKPIRRPALKRVLQKFATILEEPETTSPTAKSTSRPGTPAGGAKAEPSSLPNMECQTAPNGSPISISKANSTTP